MSIDLFFVAAPFLCRDDRELAVFSRRVALAIAIGGLCFLVMPLKLAVDRPQLDGWLGAMFGWFFVTDMPYNLCPSLHIALRTLLAEKYAAPHPRAVERRLARVVQFGRLFDALDVPASRHGRDRRISAWPSFASTSFRRSRTVIP